MGVKIGPESNNYVTLRDKERFDRSEVRTSNATKEAETSARVRNQLNGSFRRLKKVISIVLELLVRSN